MWTKQRDIWRLRHAFSEAVSCCKKKQTEKQTLDVRYLTIAGIQ